MKFRSLPGFVAYDEASELQRELVDARARDEIEDTVLFLEHEPVITRGRGLQFTGEPRPRHMPLPVLPPGIAFSESERGGDLTYHGPGQLVIYPIVKLDDSGFGPRHDVAGFLRRLEGVLIEELSGYGLAGESRAGATGVWVPGGPGAGERKIASVGIAVRKWVTFHGAALNVVNDLAPFHLISPCGFSPEVMTRLADQAPVGEGWRARLEGSLARRFEAAAVTSGARVAAGATA